jgi:transcriptional regulator GlxA family with amidase domain
MHNHHPPNASNTTLGMTNLSVATGWQALALTFATTICRTSYATQAAQLHHYLSTPGDCSSADWQFMQVVLEQLYATRGQIRMEKLAAQAALSLRQFERRFKGLIGFTPKLIARMIRFETIRHRLLVEPDARLTDLAYAAGYSDQAHFIHDFRAIAGCSPQQFLALARQRSMTGFYNPSDPRPSILSVISINLSEI